jgi:c-di-GMP-binding flagellar brake protein YcgR
MYREGLYPARLENISMAGALVTLELGDEPDISRGERCSLALYRGGSRALRMNTRMVHLGYGMACLRFVNLDQDTRLLLRSMISRQMPQSRLARPRASACR